MAAVVPRRSSTPDVPHVKLIEPRPITSNKVVAGKATQNTALPKPRKLSKTVTKPQAKESQDDIVDDSEPDCQALGGMGEEDDTLEKEAAMSSPMKGSESREVCKARIHYLTVGDRLTACVFQSLIKAKVKQEPAQEEGKVKQEPAQEPGKQRIKRARLEALPVGANLKNVFSRKVIPLFLVLAHSGEAPWLLNERDIEPLLQEAWNKVYLQSLPFETSKGTVPYELVLFFLSNPSLTLLIIA